MKKLIKKIALLLLVLTVLLAFFVVAWVFWIFPSFVAPKDEIAEVKPGYIQISEESEKIDFNEENGMLYVNNEVIVLVVPSASEDQITTLFDSFDVEIDESMADANVYRLVFQQPMTYDELELLINRMKSDPIVDNSYLNVLSEFEGDTTDPEDDFVEKSPAFPDDPWIGVTRDCWYTPLLHLWHQYTLLICMAVLAYIALCIAVPVTIRKICVRIREKKTKMITGTAPAPAPIAEQVQELEPAPVLADCVSNEVNLLCPNCKSKVASEARFCMHCGFDMQTAQAKEMERVCKNCGQLCKKNEMYCGKCGTKLEEYKAY